MGRDTIESVEAVEQAHEQGNALKPSTGGALRGICDLPLKIKMAI